MHATPAPSPSTGPRTFKIHACIGRGGFGEVYLATVHQGGGEPVQVALKVLHAGVAPGSEAVRRLRDERRMLGALAHPCILVAHDLAVLDGRVALVTEYVDGEDLSTTVLAGPVPVAAALEIGAHVLDALLAAATAVGSDGRRLALVHRDVKPSNIRLGRDGGVKLLDFGVARAEGMDREANTATDMVLGSLPYLAPELLTGEPASHLGDVYAVGASVFEAVTGERLLRHREPELIGLLLHSERFEEHVGARLGLVVDAELSDALRRLLAHDPDERPDLASAHALLTGLARERGHGLAVWCAGRVWATPRHLPGALSGRVLTEDMVDPNALPAHTMEHMVPADPDSQAVTVVEDPGEGSDTISRGNRVLKAPPPRPSVAPASAVVREVPPSSTLPERTSTQGVRAITPARRAVRAGAALAGLAVLAAFLLGTFALVYLATLAALGGM